jgi:hypothetical protein
MQSGFVWIGKGGQRTPIEQLPTDKLLLAEADLARRANTDHVAFGMFCAVQDELGRRPKD